MAKCARWTGLANDANVPLFPKFCRLSHTPPPEGKQYIGFQTEIRLLSVQDPLEFTTSSRLLPKELIGSPLLIKSQRPCAFEQTLVLRPAHEQSSHLTGSRSGRLVPRNPSSSTLFRSVVLEFPHLNVAPHGRTLPSSGEKKKKQDSPVRHSHYGNISFIATQTRHGSQARTEGEESKLTLLTLWLRGCSES